MKRGKEALMDFLIFIFVIEGDGSKRRHKSIASCFIKGQNDNTLWVIAVQVHFDSLTGKVKSECVVNLFEKAST